MSEPFEEKLGAILSNQEAMSQIMALAKSLGGASQDVSASASPAPPPSPAPQPPADIPSPAAEGIGEIGGIDPRLISMAMRLAGEYNSNDDDRTALLNALRPFVKPERYAKLDKAIQISKLTRIVRIALDSFRNKGEDGHV